MTYAKALCTNRYKVEVIYSGDVKKEKDNFLRIEVGEINDNYIHVFTPPESTIKICNLSFGYYSSLIAVYVTEKPSRIDCEDNHIIHILNKEDTELFPSPYHLIDSHNSKIIWQKGG